MHDLSGVGSAILFQNMAIGSKRFTKTRFPNIVAFEVLTPYGGRTPPVTQMLGIRYWVLGTNI